MNIPFLDLKRLHQDIESELESTCQKVIRSGWFILGQEVEAFETEFADYCKAT